MVEIEEMAEKRLAALRTPTDYFAYWLSQFTSSFVVGLGVVGAISLANASTIIEGLLWLAVIGVGLLVSFGVIGRGVKLGQLTQGCLKKPPEFILRGVSPISISASAHSGSFHSWWACWRSLEC